MHLVCVAVHAPRIDADRLWLSRWRSRLPLLNSSSSGGCLPDTSQTERVPILMLLPIQPQLKLKEPYTVPFHPFEALLKRGLAFL